MYGEGTVIDQTYLKWFVKFHAGNFSLDDAPLSARPVEVDSDQIETLIESNWESSIETHTLPYVKLDSQWKFAIWHRDLKSGALW